MIAELRSEIDVLKARVLELEKLTRIVPTPPGAKRYSLVQRVLAGASTRMRGFGHRWIVERLDPMSRTGYAIALVGAVANVEDVRRQVNRAAFVMQCAAASIEGVTVERWYELHGKEA
jgi:hypothetical protein